TTGLITIVVPGSNVGVTAPGTITKFFAMSTLLPADRASSPLDMMPNDGIATGSLTLVSTSVCGPNSSPLAVLSATKLRGSGLQVALDGSRSYDPDATSSDPQLRD